MNLGIRGKFTAALSLAWLSGACAFTAVNVGNHQDTSTEQAEKDREALANWHRFISYTAATVATALGAGRMALTAIPDEPKISFNKRDAISSLLTKITTGTAGGEHLLELLPYTCEIKDLSSTYSEKQYRRVVQLKLDLSSILKDSRPIDLLLGGREETVADDDSQVTKFVDFALGPLTDSNKIVVPNSAAEWKETGFWSEVYAAIPKELPDDQRHLVRDLFIRSGRHNHTDPWEKIFAPIEKGDSVENALTKIWKCTQDDDILKYLKSFPRDKFGLVDLCNNIITKLQKKDVSNIRQETKITPNNLSTENTLKVLWEEFFDASEIKSAKGLAIGLWDFLSKFITKMISLGSDL